MAAAGVLAVLMAVTGPGGPAGAGERARGDVSGPSSAGAKAAADFDALAADVAGGRYAALGRVAKLTDEQKAVLARALSQLKTGAADLLEGQTPAQREAQIEDQYARARQSGDAAAMTKIMTRRTELRGKLRDWADRCERDVLSALSDAQREAWFAEALFVEVMAELKDVPADAADEIRLQCAGKAGEYAAAAAPAARAALVRGVRQEAVNSVLTTDRQRQQAMEARLKREESARAAQRARDIAEALREAQAAIAAADKDGRGKSIQPAKARAAAPASRAEAVVRAAMNPDAAALADWTDQTFSWTHPEASGRVFCYVTHARGYESYLATYSPGGDGASQPAPPARPGMFVAFVLIKGGNLDAQGQPLSQAAYRRGKSGPAKWDGYVVVEGGTAHMTSTFRFEGGDVQVPTQSPSSVAWLSWTSWHHDCVLVRLELPHPEAYVHVRAGGLQKRIRINLIPPEIEDKLQKQAKDNPPKVHGRN
ncbi:MAG: hypothetical protein LLG01_19815 [Planctomycetaceae bacterium]|nr:hypothetical protein [Planctomycetaceae bacterium]